ncbi:MAG TPA: polysaccharide deacetylase family protein [Acidimicrobiales bacterium]|jgi:peptidoglycan/xylan/chitin deacetylase (PgdA/CDA1 family)
MIGAPTVILCYHRVAGGVSDPYRLCVTPEHFAAQVELLGRRASFVTLDEVTVPSRSPRVVLTFDDGYADNLHAAVPIARRAGVPLTVYVATGLVGDTRGFWWDRLAQIVRFDPGDAPAQAALQVGETAFAATIDGPDNALKARADLHRLLRPMAPDRIAAVLVDLAEQLGRPAEAPADARPLTAGELATLAAEPGVTIGAHTVDHPLLRAQSADRQRETMVASRDALRESLGRDVTHFAYPFGGTDSFDTTTVTLARSVGFSTATTTVPGSVGRSPDPHALRRRLVMDWPAPRFRAQMLRWGIL